MLWRLIDNLLWEAFKVLSLLQFFVLESNYLAVVDIIN